MIVTRAPLRISLAGGGTDLPAWYEREPGAVVSLAIDKYVHIGVKRHFDPGALRVAYSRTENVAHAGELAHDLVRQALLATGLSTGLEIVSVADVPGEGSGLGSSSSYLVALLLGLETIAGMRSTTGSLAERACRIEMVGLARGCGKQDQYAAVFGGLLAMRFLEGGQVQVKQMKDAVSERVIPELEDRLMLVWTGRGRPTHRILEKQQERTELLSSVRDELRAMVGLATQAEIALEEGRVDDIGYILAEGWERKKKLADGISDANIDFAYEQAVEAGAVGGKLCGAGAGGFMLLFAKPDTREAVLDRMADIGLRHLPIRICAPGAAVVLNDGESQLAEGAERVRAA